VVISNTDDNLPPYLAGKAPFVISILFIASELNVDKNPHK
jgi:hypothetical protein